MPESADPRADAEPKTRLENVFGGINSGLWGLFWSIEGLFGLVALVAWLMSSRS
jgi:hypothetical protein